MFGTELAKGVGIEMSSDILKHSECVFRFKVDQLSGWVGGGGRRGRGREYNMFCVQSEFSHPPLPFKYKLRSLWFVV